MPSTNPTKLNIERLSEKNIHITESFDCGNNELNEFLTDNALQDQKRLISATHLCLYQEKVAGYYTLCNDSVRFVEKHDERKRLVEEEDIDYTSLPAVKIARLAVQKEYRKYGIGRHMIMTIFGKTIINTESFGCRYVTADSKKESVGFYEKSGFGHLLPQDKEKMRDFIPMYFDLLRLFKEKNE